MVSLTHRTSGVHGRPSDADWMVGSTVHRAGLYPVSWGGAEQHESNLSAPQLLSDPESADNEQVCSHLEPGSLTADKETSLSKQEAGTRSETGGYFRFNLRLLCVCFLVYSHEPRVFLLFTLIKIWFNSFLVFVSFIRGGEDSSAL